MRVSSTARSRMRRRVITGTLAVVNAASVSPQRAAHDTFRAEAGLGLGRDADAPVAGVLAEGLDAGPGGDLPGGLVLVGSSTVTAGSASSPGDEDLLTVDGHLDRADEPVVGHAAGEPGREAGGAAAGVILT